MARDSAKIESGTFIVVSFPAMTFLCINPVVWAESETLSTVVPFCTDVLKTF